jgi:hypothetical protein
VSTQQFRVTNFKADTLARIEQANSIIAEYGGQKLTARQVYYRFVSALIIPNTPRSYQNFTAMLTDARYAGLVDWSAIEDRGREADVPGEWDTIDEIVDAAVDQWRSPRWRTQSKYVELWVEKQALAGVLSPIARRAHVPLMVNKGYSSASAMKAAADRMIEACEIDVSFVCDNCTGIDKDLDIERDVEVCSECLKKWKPRAWGECNKRTPIVLYLGDHDPSGEDMVRDIEDRLKEFGVTMVSVVKVALTMAQIKKFNPPPNPAKITDSRAGAYIEKFGSQSWELDALPPRELNRLVEQAINRNVDRAAMDAVIAEENVQRERVRAAIERSRES